MNENIHLFNIQQMVKSVFDILLAALFLILALPILLVIALAVRMDSPGEIVYRHYRIGKNGKPFLLYKFRSMSKGGDDSTYLNYLQRLIDSEQNKNGRGLAYKKMDGDFRITRVGKILRRYYLDEIPQLLNILRGEMSWVGPRPHVQCEVDRYTGSQRRRLTVKPGCTGLWQVEGKADCTFSELIQLDLDYINNWNLLLDIKIMVKTFQIMIKGGEESWARKVKPAPASPAKAPLPHSFSIHASFDNFQIPVTSVPFFKPKNHLEQQKEPKRE